MIYFCSTVLTTLLYFLRAPLYGDTNKIGIRVPVSEHNDAFSFDSSIFLLWKISTRHQNYMGARNVILRRTTAVRTTL